MITLRLSAASMLLCFLVAGCGETVERTGATATLAPTAEPTAASTPKATRRPSPRPTPRPTSPATPSPDPTPVALELPAGAISVADAAARIGEKVTACGTVADTIFASDTAGAPTFLNLGRPYPNQVMTFVIWEESRFWYSAPPEDIFTTGTQVCAEGIVEDFNGRAEITPVTPITLLDDWISQTSLDSPDLDCTGIDDAYYAEICWDVLADYEAMMEELGQEAMDAARDDIDDYYDEMYDDYFDDVYDDYYAEP